MLLRESTADEQKSPPLSGAHRKGGKHIVQPKKKKLTTRGSQLINQVKQQMLQRCHAALGLKTKVEHKKNVPQYRGRDAPNMLTIPSLGYEHIDSKESALLVSALRSMFGNKHYEFRLSTALNMSSSGAGIVNSTLSNSVLVSQVDFVALAGVFNEFFIKGFTAYWQPVSQYQYPLGGTSTLSVANLPLGCADLQHGQAAYSSLTAMSDNFRFTWHNTGRPFVVTWVNTEKVSETVVASLTAPTQSWCTVNNASNYQGTLQFLTQSAPPALPFSQVLGTFIVHFDVLFRVRA